LLLVTAAVNAQNVTLTNNNETAYTIVLPDEPTPVEKTAASELQNYLTEITGVAFKTISEKDLSGGAKAIYVGKTNKAQKAVDFSTFKQDEIFLKSLDDGSIILAGHDQRGTIYAVYTFLEDSLGVRWWTDKESTVPKKPNLTIALLDVRYAPKLTYRETFYRVAFSNPIFAARCKNNGADCFISPEYGGHCSYQYFVHSFYNLIPGEKYFKDHPDWFPKINGVRKYGYPEWAGPSEDMKKFIASLKPEQVHPEGTQLCLSNDEMRAELTKNALEALRKNPNAMIISISQNDCFGYCTCEKCRALDEAEGTHAASLLNFVNKVAEDIEKEFPNVWVDTLAYLYTRKPPKTIKARDNVIVRLCTIECSFLKPLTDESNSSLKDDIEGWAKIAPHLFIWDYTANFSYYLQPHPNFRVLAPNIRFFIDNNAIGVFEEGDYGTTVGDFVHARSWVIAHLLWNPDLDENALWKEFFVNYYGPKAGPILLEYINFIHDKAMEANVYMRCFMGNTDQWLDAAAMNQSAQIVARARDAVKDDPVLKHRVDVALLSYDLLWVRNYAKVKEAVEKSGQPFYGPKNPRALAKAVFDLAEKEDTFQFREGGGIEIWENELKKPLLEMHPKEGN
ncbi:MAG: DUF4838 domain-containing protein, partial [Thermoguttaceae bacterium]|nr:DUF4838 domain-containing protein [Thermoguttaceae bacterium]